MLLHEFKKCWEFGEESFWILDGNVTYEPKEMGRGFVATGKQWSERGNGNVFGDDGECPRFSLGASAVGEGGAEFGVEAR